MLWSGYTASRSELEGQLEGSGCRELELLLQPGQRRPGGLARSAVTGSGGLAWSSRAPGLAHRRGRGRCGATVSGTAVAARAGAAAAAAAARGGGCGQRVPGASGLEAVEAVEGRARPGDARVGPQRPVLKIHLKPPAAQEGPPLHHGIGAILCRLSRLALHQLCANAL